MFTTTNIYVTTALCTLGEELIDTIKDDYGTVIFRFNDDDGRLTALAHAYYRNKFPAIQPADYVDNLMLIRDRLSVAR